MAQKSLFDLGFGGQKRSSDSDNESVCGTPTKRPKTDNTNDTPKSKVKRKFRTEWLSEYEWLEMKEKDDVTLLFCTWCRDAKKSNPYALSGSSNMQKSALDRHANKNPDHLELANARLIIKAKKSTKDIILVQESRQTEESSLSKVCVYCSAPICQLLFVTIHCKNMYKTFKILIPILFYFY